MAIERRDAERTRRVSDRLFRAMFMAMDDGAVSRDRNGEIVAVNPAAENILGVSAEALIGRSAEELAGTLSFIREDETPFPRECDPATLALQTGEPQRNVLMGVHRPDGWLVWISVNAHPLPSDDGSGPCGVVTTFRDVTERKRAEEALSFVAQRGWMASHEKFFDALVKYLARTLGVDHVLISILSDAPDTAETVALYARGAVVPNRRYSLKGAPCEEVMGRRFCFYPQGIQQMYPDDALLVEMGAEGYSGLPLWDSDGEPIGLIAVLDSKPLRDEAVVSQILQFVATRAAAELERERSDRSLRKSEREFRSLADNIPDRVVRHDRQGRVQYMNPALVASVPREFSAVVGESLVETFPGNTAKADLHDLIMRVIETGAPDQLEFQLPDLSGEMRTHEVRYVAERDGNGEIVGALAIGRDITERRQMEDNLRRRELEFRSLAENMPDNVIRYDRQARVQYMNPALIASLAPEFLPVLREAVTQTYPGDEGAASCERLVEQVIATGTPTEIEFELPNPQGEMRLNHVRFVAEHDGNGEIVGALGIGRDVTEQRASERQLRQALEFTEGVINAIPDLLFEADRNGTCVNVWARTPELLAVHKEALLGKAFTDLVTPDTAEVALSALREAEEKGLSYGKLLRVEIPQGARWFELSVSKKPGNDVPGRFIVLSRDVTGRKRMEDDIRRRELEFRSLAENMPDNVVRYDRQARAVYMNPAIVATVAPSFRPVLGEAPLETYPGEAGAEAHQRMVEQVIATGMPAEWEFESRDIHGEPRIHHARYVAERDNNGEIVGVLAIGRDITERKRAEEYEQFRSRTLELLAGGSPLQEVLEGIVRGVEQLKPDMLCSILLLDTEGKRLGDGVAPSLPDFYNKAVDGIEIGVGVGCCGTAAATGQRVITEDMTTHPYWAPYKELVTKAGLGACWSEPIRSSTGKVLGTFAVYHRHAHSPATFDIALIEKSTHLVSIAIERKRAEEALRASEREFRSLAENMPDNVVRHDRQARATYMNPALIASLAPEFLPVLGQSPTESHPGHEGAANHQHMLERVIATGIPAEVELQMPNPHGEIRLNQVRYLAERNSHGEIIGAMGIGRDITERKQMEDDIRRREREFRSLAENMPDNVVRYDRQARVLYMNPAMRTSLAPDIMPLLGKSHNETHRRRDSLASYHLAVERVIAMGTPFEFEFQVTNPLGEIRDHHAHIVAERAADGEIIGALAIGRDVTERNRMEQAVAVREQEFRSLAESSSDCIIRYDRDGRIRYLNSVLLGFFGMSATDIVGRRPREVWPDGRYAKMEQASARAVETGEATTVEFDQADNTGALRFHQAVVVPERDGAGQIIGSIAFGRDVTTLRETERQLRHFIENLPGMAFTFRISSDGHAHLPYVSPAIKELFGVEPDDVKEDTAPLCALTHPADLPRLEAAVAESAQTMMPCRVEFRVCRPGQPERWVSQRSVPEREADGSTLWYGIMLDITERRLAEDYEQFRSRTLELVSGGAPLPALLEEIVRGVEGLKPDMICSILLLDRQGKTLGEGVAPSLPDFYNKAVDGIEIGVGIGCCGTAAATGQRVITEDMTTHPYWAPYKELITKAGLGACWSEPIRSSTGKVLGTFAVYHRQAHSPTAFDISIIEKSTHLASIAIEHRRAEEALRASELEFRTLAENLPDFLVRYDREGRRTYLNPTMERVLAAPAGEMLGKTLHETNPTRMLMPETYQRALEHTLATGERSEFEMQLPMPGGGTLTGQCFMVAEREADGRISGAIAVTRDITERKRSEEELERHRNHLEKLVENRTLALSAAKEAAEAATRAKSHFLAAASHDLRQPLQAIRLFNDALTMSGLNEQQKKIAGTLSRSVSSLNELLNDLLDLSRLDAGTIEPHPAAVQTTDLLSAIGDEFYAVCQEKDLELRLVCTRCGLAVFTDENLLLTLLRNLVSNAVKYTRRGGVLVGIRRRGNCALIQVWDTGIGIPAEQKDSIFDEYVQIGNPERDRAKGVGLGLAIVRRLSKLLDAGVNFRSREGKGSVFQISVPLADKPDLPASLQASATLETAARRRLAGQRIVIIDDDEIVGDAIKLALEMEGAEVLLFDRPEDALRSVEAMGADCYLSDYRLPGMSGLQLLDAIQEKSAAPIKAVLLTGNVSPDQLALLRSSHWKVMLKPVALEELLSAIDGREVVH